jgi:hypothetical protein
MIRILLPVTFVLAFGVVGAIVLLDWLGGCGEMFVYADGSRHMGDCIGREIFFNLFKRG